MISFESSRNESGIFELVSFAVGKSDGKRLDWLVNQLTHHRRNCRRIDPTRQKHSERYICHQSQFHRLSEQVAPFVDVVLVTAAFLRALRKTDVPILCDFDFAV